MSRFLLPAILLGLFAVLSVKASEWHGIVPLHSTRADVLRILGEPNSKYDRYLIDGEEATIIYSRGPCLSGWNVPTDTVMIISVTFKQITKLADLKINLDKYDRIRDPLVTSHVYYTNRDEGVRYEVFDGLEEKGTVLEVNYEPTSKDEMLFRCEKKPEVKIPDHKCVRERMLSASLGGPHLNPQRESALVFYDLGEETATFLYTNGLQCGEPERSDGRVGGWKVPQDTVVEIFVYFKSARRLTEFKIDETKFKKVRDPEMTGLSYYTDGDEGVTMAVGNGIKVYSMTYSHSAKDESLRCSKSSKNQSKPRTSRRDVAKRRRAHHRTML